MEKYRFPLVDTGRLVPGRSPPIETAYKQWYSRDTVSLFFVTSFGAAPLKRGLSALLKPPIPSNPELDQSGVLDELRVNT